MPMLRRWKQRRSFGKYSTLSPNQEPNSSNLKVVSCNVNLRKKDEDNYFDFRWLLMNKSVAKFSVSVNCKNASLGEVEEGEAAARYAVKVHPNRPTVGKSLGLINN